jgi:hypothetical protein
LPSPRTLFRMSYIWYTDSLKETGTEYRGLSPHKITPMLGVLQRNGGGDVSGNGESTPAAR